MNSHKEQASFRDPNGFIFSSENEIYRQINQAGKEDFEMFESSGLYKSLLSKELIIEHHETSLACPEPEKGWKVIRPTKLDFVSYPYEWSFSQLKDAALATLEIQKTAFAHKMCLRDASAYNIQFYKGKPLLIDSLSFASYKEGSPWVPYRQFCQHFLAPLALMSYRDQRLSQLLKVYIDGLPLDLTSKLLPFRSNFNLGILMHIILHSRSQSYYADSTETEDRKANQMSKISLMGLIDSLESGINSLKPLISKTQWGDYYSATNYSSAAELSKMQTVEKFIDEIKPNNLWDLGANTGHYSRLATKKKIPVLAFDIDVNAVEINYLESRKKDDIYMSPLLLDLANPSPAIGWENFERRSFMQRGPADCIMALALIHHLVIANNVPMQALADFFAKMCSSLIIEFVPKSDSQVKRLLATREDIFSDYRQDSFEECFTRNFDIVLSEPVKDSERTLYLMKKKNL